MRDLRRFDNVICKFQSTEDGTPHVFARVNGYYGWYKLEVVETPDEFHPTPKEINDEYEELSK